MSFLISTTSLFALLLLISLSGLLRARDVEVEIVAPWKQFSTNLLPQIADHLHRHGHRRAAVWDFLDKLCLSPEVVDHFLRNKSSSSSFQEHLRRSWQAVLPVSLHSITEAMLGLGSYAAAVPFHHNLSPRSTGCARGQPVVVLLPGQRVLCDPSAQDLLALHASGSENQFHRLVDSVREGGPIGSFSVRHLLEEEEEMTTLTAFGAFLDIKNMEYKNEVAGINFQALFNSLSTSLPDNDNDNDREKQLAELRKDLAALREELVLHDVSTSSDVQGGKGGQQQLPLKTWQLANLGLQAVQYFLSMQAKTSPALALGRLAQIIKELPAHAALLAHLRVSQAVRQGVEVWYQGLAGGEARSLTGSPPAGTLFVNNRAVALGEAHFNLHEVMEIVFEEAEVLQRLRALPLKKKQQNALQELALRGGKVRVVEQEEEEEGGSRGEVELKGTIGEIIRIDVSGNSKGVLHFLNNLEKDSMYRSWPSSLTTLLYPSWANGGGPQAIARNLYTAIAFLDLLSPQGAQLFLIVQMMVGQGYPVRFAFVNTACYNGNTGDGNTGEEEEVSRTYCRLFAQRLADKGLSSATRFASKVAQHVHARAGEGLLVTSEEVVALFAQATSSSTAEVHSKFLHGPVSDYPAQQDYLDRLSVYLTSVSIPRSTPLLIVNGVVLDVELHRLQGALLETLSRDQFLYQYYLQRHYIEEETKSLYVDFLKLASRVYTRYSPLLASEVENSGGGYQAGDYLSAEVAQRLVQQTVFLTPTTPSSSSSRVGSNTLVVVLDAEAVHRSSALATAVQALNYLRELRVGGGGGGGRKGSGRREVRDTWLALLWRSSSSSSITTEGEVEEDDGVLPLLQALPGAVAGTLAHLSKQKKKTEVETVVGLLGDEVQLSDVIDTVKSALATRLLPRRPPAEEVLPLLQLPSPSSERTTTIVYNGRIFRLPGYTSSGVLSEDFELLRGMEDSRLSDSVAAALSLGSAATTSPRSLTTSFLLACLYLGDYRVTHPVPSQAKPALDLLVDSLVEEGSPLVTTIEPPEEDLESSVDATSAGGGGGGGVGGGGGDDSLSLVFLLDPLTTAAQRSTTLWTLFRDLLGYRFTIVLVPRLDLSELPLTSFYASALTPSSSSSSSYSETDLKRGAHFHSLPHKHVLTLRPDVPERWVLQTMQARQDTDNLRWQCMERMNDRLSPAHGLQLLLTSPPPPPPAALGASNATLPVQRLADTVVMQNLGYFQLQLSEPRLAYLQLAPGRGADLYTISSSSSFTTTTATTTRDHAVPGKLLAVKSFSDDINRLVVAKRPGREQDRLLGGDDDGGGGGGEVMREGAGFWSSLTQGLFNLATGKASLSHSAAHDEDTIHVFSVATGRMYERLLRIMLLSVHKRTSRKVKFWLLENYLSPHFKARASAMAEHYHFEIAYVTYKWPSWLRAQTNQQRIIWGYKILFLDVLFPLDVHKIIYVDADQVLRTDLAELWDIDLQGMPYAYVPFCDTRAETLGFQFWRSGYWKDHLQGKPYHISALYVVDLDRFRRYGVGDILRSIYDQLARDPNSLANLDQDLPNFAQHQVPIYSLPQEWLWCETWCSDSSKSQAKTIDLCNNPLHKEPKLDMARRVVSGPLFNESWTQLDEEIRTLIASRGLDRD
eukprot:gene11330-12645_t